MKKAVSFLRLTRAEFLLGGIALFWLGTRAGGDISIGRYLLGQGLVTSIQLVAQYANEYFDLDADTAHDNRTWFSGGSGVLAAGRLGPIVAKRAAQVAAAMAVLIAVAALAIDWRLTAIGAIALVGSWWYSAPPVRLVASGFGELTTAIVVGGLVPLTGAVAAGDIQARLLTSFVAPTCLVTFALLMAVHAPDADSDARVGKRTLTVRLGLARSAQLHRAVSIAAIASIFLLAAWRPDWSTGLAVPGAALLMTSTMLISPHPSGTRANLLTFAAVASLVAVSLGFGLGTLLT
ncbi:MAG: prenyltransferase [Acidimicrobiia bacterium]|nr:prenyltransferase [Acidimicrobiia bacterium]NNF09453.1 prenyltransferase [Acidimicrobiia bacterium]NNL71679.1 prenyltransferase [Acidimicrobiia bacterium]